MEIKRREADYLGVTLDDTEAKKYCSQVCRNLFNEEVVLNLDAGQRIQLAQTLRTRYKLSFRQLAKLAELPLSEIRKYV